MNIHLIAAARPNFMKIAPLYHALKKEKWANPLITHTGQHYDINMSDSFFSELGLPEPDFHLGVGSGTHAEQTGRIMMAYESVLSKHKVDLVVVVGDVNSTLAVSLTAVKLGIKVAHLEAGLRSFDRTMPEEINRLVTDTLADILWTPSPDADENLLREGAGKEKIIRVGNIMIDSLEMARDAIEKQNLMENFGLVENQYGIATLHRPSNVDEPEMLGNLCRMLMKISEKYRLVFPVHPRTKKNLIQYGLFDMLNDFEKIVLLDPLNYTGFMNLVFHCRFVITDSGGVQEETTYLGVPCMTLRPNTERPITISQGTNRLCSPHDLENGIDKILTEIAHQASVPELWDGKTAQRVVESIKNLQ